MCRQCPSDELDALILRAEKSELIEGDAKIIKALVETVKTLSQAVDDKAASIKRLLQRVFGSSSEKSKDILNPDESDQQNDSNQNDSNQNDKDQGEQGQSDENENGQNGNADASDQSEGDSPPKMKKGGKPKGCGKNGKDKYHGAEKKYIEHEELKPGQHCLECKMGKVYLDKDPITYLRVTGNSPVSATLYELEKKAGEAVSRLFYPVLQNRPHAARSFTNSRKSACPKT